VKRVLTDTNVILDVLLDRKPHVTASAAVWAAIETGAAEGFLAAHAVTTIYYLVRKEKGSAAARRTVNAVLRVLSVAPLDGAVIRRALELAWPDFEDSVTAAAAESAGCDLIVTRDPAGFPRSPVQAVTPEVAVILLAQGSTGER
jgi:predicted nucleic acid-binding protein